MQKRTALLKCHCTDVVVWASTWGEGGVTLGGPQGQLPMAQLSEN